MSKSNDFGRRSIRQGDLNVRSQREPAKLERLSVSLETEEPSVRPVPAIPENLRIAFAGLVAFGVGTFFEAQFGFSPKMWFIKVFGAILIFYPVISWLWKQFAGRSLERDLNGPGEKAIRLTEWIGRNRAVLIIVGAALVVFARIFLHVQ